MKKIAVIGAGSWGTALATVLAGKGHEVRITDINMEHLKLMEEHRENVNYLPGVKLNENIHIVGSGAEALEDADYALFSAPAQHFRSAIEAAIPHMKKDLIVINVAKGIEQKTLLRMSEIASDYLDMNKYVVLSGPSHAEEVGRRMPTTVAVASKCLETAEDVQELFMTDRFRVYTNDDVVGIELGGSLKNIIALGAGISDGMGFGDNAKAALMTRGLAEIKRLGLKLGARPETFAGLAGVGDLIVTCTSMHSRNRRCGIMIGEGMDPKEATDKVGMVVEGMFTTEAAYGLAEREGIEMPITEAIYDVINGKANVEEIVASLMTREKRHEEDKK